MRPRVLLSRNSRCLGGLEREAEESRLLAQGVLHALADEGRIAAPCGIVLLQMKKPLGALGLRLFAGRKAKHEQATAAAHQCRGKG